MSDLQISVLQTGQIQRSQQTPTITQARSGGWHLSFTTTRRQSVGPLPVIPILLLLYASRYADVNLTLLTNWIFASAALQLYTGECPFAGTRMDHAVMMRVLQGERPSRVISVDDSGLSMSDDLWDLLRRCWSQEPSNRPPMYQVAELMKGFQQDTPSILQGHPWTYYHWMRSILWT